MPCAYAHFRLGRQVFGALPGDMLGAISPFRELFDIGLHGPDIFFYHSPVIPDRVTKLGHATHALTGAQVFTHAASVLRDHRDNPMYKAYVYGCLCHFALDCMCHGCVNRFAKERGVSHNEIEMEFDRMLEVTDGLDPLRHDTAAHIVASRRNCAVIAAFYPGISLHDVERSLRTMPVCLHTLLAPDMRARKVLLTALRATGRYYKDLSGLVMSLEPNPVCRESSKRLMELYKLAVPLAMKLIKEFDSVSEGRLEPDRHLELNYLSKKVK